MATSAAESPFAEASVPPPEAGTRVVAGSLSVGVVGIAIGAGIGGVGRSWVAVGIAAAGVGGRVVGGIETSWDSSLRDRFDGRLAGVRQVVR